METYPTLRQATGVARILSKRSSCTIVVYRQAEGKFVAAHSTDRVEGSIEGVYRDGYVVPTLLSKPER
ncbi:MULTISPECIES: hypothetical protein [Variovorax]|jgi:hypothetical protein|uniref:Uncharacterized protein n=1 Tax=Variovorax paradoxus TaxID=34073 RepID=A0AA91I9Q1_VARPD|nr:MULTISPECIES: hypothetical protein [Variovorax]OAK61208.1 hypothetical protein A3K87_22160 [Variovorax paradoxus]QRY30293.1 hypothetical protein JVX96_19635 [Variovorax sp. PDNC026]